MNLSSFSSSSLPIIRRDPRFIFIIQYKKSSGSRVQHTANFSVSDLSFTQPTELDNGFIIVSDVSLVVDDVLCCTWSPRAVLGVPVATGIPNVAVFSAVVRIRSVLAVTLLYSLASVAEAYTTQPNSKASSRVLYIYLACMAG
jgi:hypothetical protein